MADTEQQVRLSVDGLAEASTSTSTSAETAAHTEGKAAETDMPTDVAQLQDELKATREQRDSLEQQYQSLLSKLTQIRSTLGTRLKQDADELDRRQSQIASLTASQADLQSTVSTLQAELMDSHAEQDRLRSELDAQRQASASSSNSIDSATRQAAESAARVSALTASLTALQAERESVEERYHTERAQREQAQMELEMSRVAREVAERAAHEQRMRAEREAQSARQLQDVLEEYQQNGMGGGDGAFDSELGDHHVHTLGGGSSQREKIGQLAEELELHRERANTAESQLADYKNAAERCERLEREVKEKNLFVGKLRHEAVILNEHLTEALRRLRADSSSTNVDRRLITNLLLRFLSTPRADPKRFEILTLIASVLGWDEEERGAAGLALGSGSGAGTGGAAANGMAAAGGSGGILGGWRGRGRKSVGGQTALAATSTSTGTAAGSTSSGSRTPGAEESFSNLFLEFLLTEAGQAQPDTSTSSQSQAAALSPSIPATAPASTTSFVSSFLLRSSTPSAASSSQTGGPASIGTTKSPSPRTSMSASMSAASVASDSANGSTTGTGQAATGLPANGNGS
ncbi:hypothetical protein A4X13_0g2234 [Tilletia indica]|uniref:Uncharacterized protein n=1 Tax=Tilletia indica TaxID=43049 RepID=A0A177TIX5_9BASI|nr:hypothetical protein A4X13_0g2234 [Tilletia indica]